MPGPSETLLLRACLCPGPEGRAAWEAFQAQAGDLRELFRADYGAKKRLGPLLAHALRRQGIPADRAVLTVLRTSSLREELRTQAYQEILDEVTGALQGEGVSFVVLKGAALGPTVYERPELRHSHDIDLLCRPEESDAAFRALRRAGLRPLMPPGGPDQPLRLEHRSSLPVNLHRRLFTPACFTTSWEEVWPRTREGPGGVRHLAPGDNLLHVCGEAIFSPARASLQWACDAWLLMARPAELDWTTFVLAGASGGVTLPGWIMLDYMAGELGAAVPAGVLEELAEGAARTPAPERDQALFLARNASRSGALGQVALGATLGARARLFWWMLFPSAGYLRASSGRPGGDARPVPLALLRARRLVRYGGGMVRSLLR